jgi:hypothetical protein
LDVIDYKIVGVIFENFEHAFSGSIALESSRFSNLKIDMKGRVKRYRKNRKFLYYNKLKEF